MRRIPNSREAIRRQATGMTREQITKATADAASWEHHRSKVCDNDGDMAAIKGAIRDHKEWRRIGYVMAEENMETYNPDADPTVLRWRREDAERQAAETAAQHHTTENPAEQPAAADPRAQVVLTALARAGLHHLDDDDHQAVEQLAALDDATLGQVADWLERTREAALQQGAGRPQRPLYRRPRPDSWPQRT